MSDPFEDTDPASCGSDATHEETVGAGEELSASEWLTTVKNVPLPSWVFPLSLVIGAPPVQRLGTASTALNALVDSQPSGPFSRGFIMGEVILSAPLRDSAVKGTVTRKDKNYLEMKINEFRNQNKSADWTVENQAELDLTCDSAIAAFDGRVGTDMEVARLCGAPRRSIPARTWSRSSGDDWTKALSDWIWVMRYGSPK